MEQHALRKAHCQTGAATHSAANDAQKQCDALEMSFDAIADGKVRHTTGIMRSAVRAQLTNGNLSHCP